MNLAKLAERMANNVAAAYSADLGRTLDRKERIGAGLAVIYELPTPDGGWPPADLAKICGMPLRSFERHVAKIITKARGRQKARNKTTLATT